MSFLRYLIQSRKRFLPAFYYPGPLLEKYQERGACHYPIHIRRIRRIIP